MYITTSIHHATGHGCGSTLANY